MCNMSASANPETARAPVDVWIGTSLGVLKGVCLPTGRATNYLPASLSLTQTSKCGEVLVMCWEGGSYDTLYCGRRDGIVQRFSCQDRLFSAECDCTGGEGQFVGLGKHEDTLITCTDRGSLCFWPPDTDKTERCVGENVSCMAVSPRVQLQVATGGKENDLKVWDGNKLDQPVFQAKNVKNDKLDLRVPVWVSRLDYTPLSGDQPIIAVGTGHHQVRLYDTRAQRRPVYSQVFGEYPITALTVSGDGRSYYVGNSVGDMGRVDLRTGGVVSRYRGFTGGVRSVQEWGEGEQSLVAVTGLDRYLRVYSVHSPKLLHQVYLKLQCSCLLFSNESSKVPEATPTVTEPESVDCESSGEEDQLWNKMETVKDSKNVNKKRSRPGGKLKRSKRQKLRT